ncbi:SLC13 family permease [Immundisolibacter sp.]|uniref:SLC13 family permease n=1 Tax=Immundisolibacter sp. TaxID=1934948 RepID=UPI00356377EF
MGFEAVLALAVVVGIFLLLLVTRWPVEAVFLGGVVVLVGAGVLPIDRAFAGFANLGLVTVALLYVVAGGVQETGAIDWLGRALLGTPRGERRALATVAVPAAALSAFMNNTPLMALLIPLVKDWCRRIGISPSKLLLPLNHAALLGGTCVLIGTSTNLVANSLLMASGQPGLGMFELTPVGLPVAIAGLAYLLLLGPRLLPERVSVAADSAAVREYLTDMLVEAGGPLVGKTIAQAGLRSLGGLYLLEIDRGGRVLAAVGPDEPLLADDRLVFVGAIDSVVELHRIRGLAPATAQIVRLDGPRSQRQLVEAVVGPHCPIAGKSVREGRFRNRYDAAIIAVSRSGERLRSKIGDIVLRSGDTLLLEARPSFLERFRRAPDFLLVSAIDGATPRRHDRAPLALAILAGVVLSAGFGLLDIASAALFGAVAVVLTGCIGFDAARRSLDTSVLLTIGAAIGVSAALEATGAASGLAGGLLAALGSEPWQVLVAIYFSTLVLTQLITNNAAVALMIPLALALAHDLGMAPLPLALSVIMAASASYATPFGYQTNLMVYGPGGYRFSDYLRLGLPLHVITATVALALLIPMLAD